MPTVTTENSYVTLEEAIAVLDEYPGTSEWASLQDDTQAQYVIWATKLLRRLLGENAEVVPESTLKDATARQAYFLLENESAISTAMGLGVGSVNFQQVGKLSQSSTATGFDWRKTIHPEVLADLRTYALDFNTVDIVRA